MTAAFDGNYNNNISIIVSGNQSQMERMEEDNGKNNLDSLDLLW